MESSKQTHPSGRSGAEFRSPAAARPLNILVGLYNQCLGDALCGLLRSEDRSLRVHHLVGCHAPGDADIFLTDLPSLEAHAHRNCPNAKIIVIDEGLDLLQQQMIFQHPGVNGIIQPDCSDQMLIKAIHCVADGELWIDGATVKQLLNSHLPRGQMGSVHLTRKEGQIVDLVLQGLKNKAIASEVFLSESTVKVYLSRVFRKFGVKNRCQLITRLTQTTLLN